MSGGILVKDKNILVDRRYLKIIEKNNKYAFRVYPRNNRIQFLGTSIEYENLEDCKTASRSFIKLVIEKSINSYQSRFIELDKEKRENDVWYYKYVLMDSDKKPLFYQKPVLNKTNSKKGVASLYDTISECLYGKEILN